MEENWFLTSLDEVEVETGFETSMVVKPPGPNVSKDAEIVATCFFGKVFCNTQPTLSASMSWS